MAKIQNSKVADALCIEYTPKMMEALSRKRGEVSDPNGTCEGDEYYWL